MSRKPDPRQIDLFGPAAMVQPLPLEKAIAAASPTPAPTAAPPFHKLPMDEQVKRVERDRLSAEDLVKDPKWKLAALIQFRDGGSMHQRDWQQGLDLGSGWNSWLNYGSGQIYCHYGPGHMAISEAGLAEIARLEAELAPPIADEPKAAPPSDEREIFTVGPDSPFTMEQVCASYSAQALSEKIPKVGPPFAFRGALWVDTGTMYCGGGVIEATCYRIIPAADYTGGPRQQYGYHGTRAKHRGQDIVIIGPPVLFINQAAADRRAANAL